MDGKWVTSLVSTLPTNGTGQVWLTTELLPTKTMTKSTNFQSVNSSPWLSDHCPIYTEININIPKQKELEKKIKLHHEEPVYICIYIYIWNENVKDAFHALLENWCSSTRVEPTLIAEKIKNTLLDIAKECNLRIIKLNSLEPQMSWFDTECLNTKNKICHLGNKVRKKNRQHQQKIMNEIENNKNKDLKIFWKLTKN